MWRTLYFFDWHCSVKHFIKIKKKRHCARMFLAAVHVKLCKHKEWAQTGKSRFGIPNQVFPNQSLNPVCNLAMSKSVLKRGITPRVLEAPNSQHISSRCSLGWPPSLVSWVTDSQTSESSKQDAPGKCYWGTFWAPVEEYIDPGWATGIKCMDLLPRRSHNMLCQLCVLWISPPTRCPQENVAGEMWVAGSRVHISDSGWTRCIKLMEPFLRIRPNMP